MGHIHNYNSIYIHHHHSVHYNHNNHSRLETHLQHSVGPFSRKALRVPLGRGRPSTPAPRRGTTRASSGAPPWWTRRATMSPAKDNMGSALQHVTRDSGGSREQKTDTNQFLK